MKVLKKKENAGTIMMYVLAQHRVQPARLGHLQRCSQIEDQWKERKDTLIKGKSE